MSNSERKSHKVVNLTRSEQITAYRNAKTAVKRELEQDDVTQGEVVRELARAYTGFTSPPGVIPELVDDHASRNGDPVFDYTELEEMSTTRLRNLAADANTDAVYGKSTRLELMSYFAAGAVSESDAASD